MSLLVWLIILVLENIDLGDKVTNFRWYFGIQRSFAIADVISLCATPFNISVFLGQITLQSVTTSFQQAVSWPHNPTSATQLAVSVCLLCLNSVCVCACLCLQKRLFIHCITLQSVSVEQAVSWPTHNPTSASQLAATTWRQTLVCWH